MSGTDNGDGDNPNMKKFELYIKASAIDKETKGSCPICQQFFMITCLLGENQEDVDFKVFTVQADCPPKNFASGWSKKYPVVMVNSARNKAGQDISGMMYDTFEDLETFFESINRECPELKRKNAPNLSALSVVENLYKHFNHFIAGQPEKALVAELKKLNEYLESQDTKFLVDNVLSFSDCHLLPRLQHIRVAGKAFRDFDIPKEFTYIWRYIRDAYEQDAFRSTMPSDQDIIFHYEKKACNPPKVKGKGKGKPTLEKFTYTMDVPEDILNGLGNGTATTDADGGATQEEEQVLVPEPTYKAEPEETIVTPPVEEEEEQEADKEPEHAPESEEGAATEEQQEVTEQQPEPEVSTTEESREVVSTTGATELEDKREVCETQDPSTSVEAEENKENTVAGESPVENVQEEKAAEPAANGDIVAMVQTS